MPQSTSSKPPADIDKTSARQFPLVHKLIHFADLRNFYRDMREALITANRRAGAQQGLVTKAKKKIAQLEAEMAELEHERDDLLAYRQRVEEEANQISAVLPRLKGRLLQVQQIEQAHGCTSRGQPQRAAAMAGVALPGSTAGGGRSCLGGAR